MPFRSDFPLHRPELLDSLRRGDALLAAAMGKDRKRFKKGDEIIRTGERCDVARQSGWEESDNKDENPGVAAAV